MKRLPLKYRDDSDVGIVAVLEQAGRPVHIFSPMLNPRERKHLAVGIRHCNAIAEAVRKWEH